MSNCSSNDHETPDCTAPTDDWLARFRPWLSLIARMQVDSRLQGKFDTSDVVQQTLMEAWRSASKFRGSTDAERIAWLRKILAHVLRTKSANTEGPTNAISTVRCPSRDPSPGHRGRLNAVLASATTTPSQQAVHQEQQVALADMLNELPADYREVIVLAQSRGTLPQRGRSTHGANRGRCAPVLWVRALQELRELAQRRRS